MRKSLFCGLSVGLLITVLAALPPHALRGTAYAQQTKDTAVTANFAKIGYALMKEKIGFLSLGISEDIVLKNLGDPEKKSTARIWGADGMEHQSWYYPAKGLEFDMVRKDGKQVVDRISIERPCDYKTQRGIQIGSSAADVQTAYKNEINPQYGAPDSSIVAGTVFGGIIFGIKDGRVHSIFVGASAE